MRVEAWLAAQARRAPEREAVADGERRLGFGALAVEAGRVARALVELGVRRGDRVAICLDNCVECVAAIFGALGAGAAFMMVNPSTKPAKLAQLLDHAQARVLVISGRKLAGLGATVDERAHLAGVIAVGGEPPRPCRPLVSYAELTADAAPPPPPRGLDVDLAALLYTSGSSGDPKGVMLTHANIASATESIVEYLRLDERDVIFQVLPLSFGYGLTQLFGAVRAGARLVLENGLTFPHLVLTRLGAERATGFAVVPTMAATLLSVELSRYRLGLRYLTCAGGALAPEQAQRLQAALPGTQIIPMYGQTECLRALYLEPGELAARPGSVGRGMPNEELYLLDEAGREAAPGEVGELVVRGAHVMRGYWRLPEETARKLRPLPPELCAREQIPEDEKLLHTGDLFRRDGDGYFYFVGRTDAIIKSRGEKVSPHEVEMALHALEGVVEAAVVGAPHPVLGEAVKAIVVLAPGVQLTEQQIRRHCAALLEDHMVPQLVEFRAELPKNERGKILRRAL